MSSDLKIKVQSLVEGRGFIVFNFVCSRDSQFDSVDGLNPV